MSRIGKQPIAIANGVTITVDNGLVTVKGPKGELSQPVLDGIVVKEENGTVVVSRASDIREHRARHGLIRTLIANMIKGVTDGFSKKLEIHGVGYRVAQQGTDLKLNLGFSHDVIYKIPTGINAAVEQNNITISGISKQQVGQVAAEIRALKKPEPYKGKGIRYEGERILRKSGKSGKDK
ncbi:MAG: 50S ribosomal protein L6 [bacterium]|nr:50S ribosomal protein L6 [bacterium]